MNRPEAIAFSKKRVIEQNDYINKTSARKDISYSRKRELLICAIIVRQRFRGNLIHFLGLAGYVAFRLYEEY